MSVMDGSSRWCQFPGWGTGPHGEFLCMKDQMIVGKHVVKSFSKAESTKEGSALLELFC